KRKLSANNSRSPRVQPADRDDLGGRHRRSTGSNRRICLCTRRRSSFAASTRYNQRVFRIASPHERIVARALEGITKRSPHGGGLRCRNRRHPHNLTSNCTTETMPPFVAECSRRAIFQ